MEQDNGSLKLSWSLILDKLKTYDSKLSLDINDVFLKLDINERLFLYFTKKYQHNFKTFNL